MGIRLYMLRTSQLYLFSLLLIWPGLLYSLPISEKTPFDRLTVDEGLAQNIVYTITQDSLGFMWYGTQDAGLSRYNGYDITNFSYDPANPDGLAGNSVSYIFVDRQGYLWIGMWGSGVDRLDPKTLVFKHYKNDPNDPTSLSDNRGQVIFEDRQGRLWIGTGGGGLNLYNRQQDKFIYYQNDPANANSLSHNRVWALCDDDQGNLWIGTNDGLCRFDPKTAQFTVYRNDPASAGGLIENRIRCLFFDSQNMLWIGTRSGLNRLDPRTGEFARFFHNPDDPYSLSDSGINYILEDHNQVLWVGTISGLNALDRANNRFVRFESNPNDPHSLSHHDIRALFIDYSKILWVATRGGGLNKLDLKPSKFLLYHHELNNSNSLSVDRVRAIFHDRSDDIWVGTDGGGLNRITHDANGNEKYVLYLNDPKDPTSLPVNDIYSVYEDHTGSVWVGTNAGGLGLLDRETGRFKNYTHNAADSTTVSDNKIYAIYEDRAGFLWLGTDDGLNIFDRQTQKFQRFKSDPKNPNSLSDKRVLTIYEDHNGVMWIGTDDGLNRLDRQTGTFKRYRHDPENKVSLSDNDIFSIYEDKDGILWIGTGRGLNRLAHQTETFRAFTEADGLPANAIYGILPDKKGNLWLSTFKGLCCFNPQTYTTRNYDHSDGLQSNEFIAGAYFLNQSGEMLFGGVGGFNRFSPEQVMDNPYKPRIALTSFKVFEKSYDLGGPLTGIERISLPYQDNFFSFEFAALDYTLPLKNQYTYMLKGFDHDWIPAGHRHFASYTNVDGGHYTLKVRASNNDGVWNETGLEIPIIVARPPWKTWWAYTLYVLAIVVIVGGYVRFKTVAQEQEIRRQQVMYQRIEELVKQRTKELESAHQKILLLEKETVEKQMAGGFAHEMRNALSGAMMVVKSVIHEGKTLCEHNAELLGITYDTLHGDLQSNHLDHLTSAFQQIERNEEKLDQVLKIVNESTDRAMRVTTLILDYSKLGMVEQEREAVDLKDVAESFARSMGPVLSEHNIEIELNLTVTSTISGHRAHFESVISNLIINARDAFHNVRDDRQKKIGIELSQQDDALILRVKDNACGIPEKNVKRLFDPFFSTKPTTGTGLGLSYVLKIINIYNGRIDVQSQENIGSTFTVFIPKT